MAKKDVMKYYDEVAEQYKEMSDNLTDMKDALENEIISPERFEAFKQSLEPLKTNYMRLSYIVFLLNKPTKFQLWLDNLLAKFGKFTERFKLRQRFDETATADAVKKENQDVIDNMKI